VVTLKTKQIDKVIQTLSAASPPTLQTAGNVIRKKGTVEEFTCSLCCWFHFFQSENVWFHMLW